MFKLLLLLVAVIPAFPAHAERGTGSSGGGNAYNGRPLESYVSDISQFPEFRAIVSPALQKLQAKLPSLAEDLAAVATWKNWYFVPVSLPEIPKEKLGVTFRTEQMALQSIDSVWFDDGMYKKMSPEDRAVILVHELVMGLKLNSMYSNYECKRFPYESRCELSRNDYEAIRRLTVIILKHQDSMSADKIADFLRANGFSRYNTAEDFRDVMPLSLEDFHLLLVSEQMAHNLPIKGKDNTGAGCAFQFKLSGDKGSLEVEIQRAVNGAALHDYVPLTITMNSQPELVKAIDGYSFRYTSPVANPKLGSYRRRLEVFFDRDRITQISSYWEQYLYDYRTRSYKWTQESNGPRGMFEPSQRICGL